jgi:glycine cleavage system H protein
MVAILVALMFVGLVLLDLVLQKLEARKAAVLAARATQPAEAARVPVAANPWLVPEGVLLCEGHAWLRPQEGAVFRAGADALVAHVLGAAARVTPPRVGQELWPGSPLFGVEVGGRKLEITSPVGGRVVAVNQLLDDRPETLVQSPYEDGWVCDVETAPPTGKERPPVAGPKAVAWLQNEFDRFAEFLWARYPLDPSLGVTSLDGGIPAPGALAELDEAAWREFEEEFLK